ncbi:MAG: GT4 family glycosyltransferase PelF [Acidimicrobiales bacterium]
MRIFLSTEGTYPYVVGGVSTWVDMLVRGLSGHQFEIGAVVDNPHHAVAYDPPGNVTVRPIPLWGLELAEEFQHNPGGWRRAFRTSPRVVRRELLPDWDRLLGAIAAPEADPATLGDALAGIAHFAERHDLRRALSDAGAWALLAERLVSNPTHARSPLGPTMHFARTLYRYLMPLAVPVPACDVAHSTAAALCALPAVVAKYRHGAPIALTEHGIYLRERLLELAPEPIGAKLLFANFYRAVVELAYREADAVLPVCGYNARWERLLGVDPDIIEVVHNGVDPAGAAPRPEPGGPPTIGFVGRVDPLKDLPTLIRAFDRVRRHVPDACLRIWGPATSDAYLARCRDVVSDLGLDGSVRFEGRTADPAAAYAACHVVALSSISEAFPYTVVEAMLASRPVVATAVGGVGEAIGDEAFRGEPLVVEPGDPATLAAALVNVLAAPAGERSALGARLRDRALRLFTADRVHGAYDRVYHDLTGARVIETVTDQAEAEADLRVLVQVAS